MTKMMRHLLVGSAVVAVAASQAIPAIMDMSTAEAVPTTCSAAQMNSIYNNCINHCETTMSSTMIDCDDVITRHVLVKCAAAADQCDSSAPSTEVVRQAQIARLNEVCSNGAVSVPLADVTLIFASAMDVAHNVNNQQQVDKMSSNGNGTRQSFSDIKVASPLNALPTLVADTVAPTMAARSSRGMYGMNNMNGNVVPTSDIPSSGLNAGIVPTAKPQPVLPSTGSVRPATGGLYNGAPSTGTPTTAVRHQRDIPMLDDMNVPVTRGINGDLPTLRDGITIDITQVPADYVDAPVLMMDDDVVPDLLASSTNNKLYTHNGRRVPGVAMDLESDILIDDLIIVDGQIAENSTNAGNGGRKWQRNGIQTQNMGVPTTNDVIRNGPHDSTTKLASSGQAAVEDKDTPLRGPGAHGMFGNRGQGLFNGDGNVVGNRNHIGDGHGNGKSTGNGNGHGVAKGVPDYTWSTSSEKGKAAGSGNGKAAGSASVKASEGAYNANSAKDASTVNATKSYGNVSSTFKTNATGKASKSSVSRVAVPAFTAIVAITLAAFFL